LDSSFTPNTFITNLARLCGGKNLLKEKWLIAPNRRVGNQWAEQVARLGQPAVNLRVTTVRSLVMGLSGTSPGRLILGHGPQILVSRVLSDLRRAEPRYFTTLEPFPSLIAALTRSLEDLRTAGITLKELKDTGTRRYGGAGNKPSFKMEELADLLAGYEEGLRDAGLVDYGGLLSALVQNLRDGQKTLPKAIMVLAPDNLEYRGLEGELADLLGVGVVAGLEPSVENLPGGEGLTDRGRLAWMEDPRNAPPPLGDGSLEILGAAGEVNEIRLVLRKCLAGGWPLDRVEILYTDRGTYLPLLFELLARHFPFESGDLDELPATFSEGIPSVYSRPGKALKNWAVWAMEGYPAKTLAGMLAEGLLVLDGEESQASRAAAADLLRRLSPGAGPGAAAQAVRAAVADLREKPGKRYDENGEEVHGRGTDGNLLRSLDALLSRLEKCTPLEHHGFTDILEGALCFLGTTVRTAGEFDEYAARALSLDLQGTLDQVKTLNHVPEGDPLGWIVSLVDEVRVAGSGPRPGRLHAAPLLLGGHTGRPHTFVLGLDDARFPGSDRQEPILLDAERMSLSPLLSLSAEPLKIREKALQALAGRTSGTLTLTCSLADLVEDRETFPGPSMVRAFRILCDPEADQEAVMAYLSPPAGFVDPGKEAFLDSAEWWTGRLAGPARVAGADAAIGRRFPDLTMGMIAAAGRMGPYVSAFDGLTGRPPAELDILSAAGPAVSSNRLQTIGSCPLRYFFKYILEVDPVEEEPPEPGKWLSPPDRGSILHDLFHVYMDGLIRGGRAPDYDRDIAGLQSLLDGLLEDHARTNPPPGVHERDHEHGQMAESARIFLREEELFARDHRPLFAEASIGLPSTDLPTELDRTEPVTLELATGYRVRVRGRVDRIDRRISDGVYVITDYKTGSSRVYKQKDPFGQGRVVQHLLYVLAVGQCLAEAGEPGARVEEFRFLFPTAQTQGEAVVFNREKLEEERAVFGHLADIAGAGCFTPTDNAEDCRWCQYKLICGDIAAQALAMAAKLEGDDTALAAMRKLRGYE